jgi:Na+-driven multidrug efflux pump
LAGQVTFVLMLFYFGISTGAGILTAQYWGKGDANAIDRVLGIGCGFSVAVSALFFLAALFLPESLMRVLTNDETLVSLGARYLRILSVSFLFMSVSQIYLAVIRSMELAKLSATISSVSLVFDTLVTALVVFVLYPHDPMNAVSGVAVSTMLSRGMELAFCMIHSMTKGKVKLRLAYFFHFDRALLRDFVKYTTPVQSNYLVWGGALAAMAAIMGHVSSDMVAANSIASVVKNLVLVLCTGIAQGGGATFYDALVDVARADA